MVTPSSRLASKSGMVLMASLGGTSRPSVKACTTTGTPAAATALASAATWFCIECTPPGETSPIRCDVPPLACSASMCSTSAAACGSEPSSMALSIVQMSWYTTRPAPMFMWPTSELPIWPTGRPTSPSHASRKATCPVWAREPNRLSNAGVGAWITALSAAVSR